MKMTQNHVDSLVRRVILELEKKKLIFLNKSKDAILAQSKAIIMKNLENESKLDQEIMRMLDDIEREQTDQFERHKMFKMLKKKVAEERGFVL